MYCKEKWCTAGGKDPLFGRVNGFQIGPKKIKKAVLPKKENGWEKGAERSVPFLKKKKPEFLWLLRHKNPG